MSGRLLLKGGCVLVLDRRAGNLTSGDVLIESGRIAEVGESIRARDADVVDCTDTIVMPGFVDVHRHLWRSLFRNLGSPDGEPSDAASRYIGHHGPDDVYAATTIGLLGAARAGTTTIADWADLPTPEHVEACVQAHIDAGLRSVVITGGGLDREGAGITPATDLVGFAHGSDDPTGDGSHLTDEWAAARAAGLRIHAHAGTARSQGAIASLGARDALGSDVTLVHCSVLEPGDLDAIAAAGVGVALTPAAEMAGELGSPQVQALIDREIKPGLGVDTEGLAPGDIFAQMRAIISVQHAVLFELKLAGKAGVPKLMTTRETIRHATINGATVLGLGEVTGSLVPGKAADLMVLRTDRPNITPVNDPIGAVVWGMDTSNIDHVIVDGKPLVRDGELVADSQAARRAAIEARARVAEAAGASTGGVT